MRRLFLVTVLSLGPWVWGGCSEPPSQDSGGPLSSQQAAYDVTYYDLAVTVHPEQQRLEGTLTVHAAVEEPLDTLVLDLDHRLPVERARPAGRTEEELLPVERRREGQERWIGLRESGSAGDTVRVTVEYGGQPREAPKPPWDGGVTWAETPRGAPWIATSNQTEGADLWWPVKDHPSDEPDSMDIAVTVPDSLVAASNGVLQGVEQTTDSTRTYQWHVSTSINAYAVTLNVAPYSRIDTTYESTSGETVPVSFYALPEDTARARATLPHFLDQLSFLEETLGPYPFRADKYGIAQTPCLGMEHQTLIAYGHDFSQRGGLGYAAGFDALHFHELVHEWFGNCLTAQDWKDFWLHEGFATYLEALYAEALEGREAYHELIDTFRARMDGTIPIARRSSVTAKEIYHRDVYNRGALVLHTLRYLVGEERLRTILRQFANPGEEATPARRCRHVETGDFLSLAQEHSGRDLESFADTYLYQSALPRLDTTRTDEAVELTWRQTTGSFEVPVPIVIDGTSHRVPMDEGRGRIEAPEGARVEIDPQGWVLQARRD